MKSTEYLAVFAAIFIIYRDGPGGARPFFQIGGGDGAKT